MGKLLIKPVNLRGSVLIPPSKSISHRAIIAAGLCDEGKKSTIENIILSDDITATVNGLRNLGVNIEIDKKGKNYTLNIKRDANKLAFCDINCMESGSTLRFLIPISLLYSDKAIFEGRGRLSERSLETYYKIFDMKGISYSNVDGRLPLTVSGNLAGGDYTVDSRVSSQFLTGLLFALPKLQEASTIYVSDKLQSKGYIDLTLDMLDQFGIKIDTTDYSVFRIKENQHYKNMQYTVEGDFSQAAFFLVANEIGCDIDVQGLNYESKQGDKEILNIIQDIRDIKKIKGNESIAKESIDKNNTANESIDKDNIANESIDKDNIANESIDKDNIANESIAKESIDKDNITKDIIKQDNKQDEKYDSKQVTTEYKTEPDYVLDVSQIPDLVPALAVLFALQDGLYTKIINAKRLRFKESDRLEAIASQLRNLGADITELSDGLEIHGKKELRGGCEVSSINDHRIAMALAIAATKCVAAVELEGYEAVTKSYPDFFDDYKNLGGEIYELDMGK